MTTPLTFDLAEALRYGLKLLGTSLGIPYWKRSSNTSDASHVTPSLRDIEFWDRMLQAGVADIDQVFSINLKFSDLMSM